MSAKRAQPVGPEKQPLGPEEQTGAATSADSYLPAHGNGGYRVTHYDLALDYRPGVGRLSGRAVLTAVAEQTLATFSLDLSGLRVDRVLVDGRQAPRYTHRGGKLRIRAARAVQAGAAFTVEVRYVGTPKPVRSAHWGDLGWDQLADGSLVASQPIGAPSWFPCNDHPSNKATYRISVTTASAHTVVANGQLIDRRVGAGSTTWVYEQRAPTPTYLVTVQIGRYRLLETSRAPVPQRGAVPARLAARFEHDFGRQFGMFAEFGRLFGPYPFDEYTVVVTDEDLEVPVEAQGVSVFGANHVDGRRGFEHLVAHELAHQWFGNSLTVADWRHIWLNEGFANYAEWLWSENSGGAPAAAHAAAAAATLADLPQDLRLVDPGVRHMFDDRVYLRGALTLHALRTTITDPVFFGLLRDWTTTHRHGTVTTEDFTTLAQRHTAEPLADLFTAWLRETALPALPRG
jgi:aminopeptidase N